MTKEQLLALKPYQEVKINSQWPASEVSVEDKRIILQNFDKQKKMLKWTHFHMLNIIQM